MSEALEILSIIAVTRGHVDDIPVDQVSRFESELHDYAQGKKQAKVVEKLSSGEKFKEDDLKLIDKMIEEFKKGFTA